MNYKNMIIFFVLNFASIYAMEELEPLEPFVIYQPSTSILQRSLAANDGPNLFTFFIKKTRPDQTELQKLYNLAEYYHNTAQTTQEKARRKKHLDIIKHIILETK